MKSPIIVHGNATNIAWSLRISKTRQDEIDELLKAELRRQADGEGTSAAALLHYANENLNSIQEVVYAASKIENLIYYGY